MGNVSIYESFPITITHLDSLSQIHSIGGSLHVYAPLTSLSGLDNLTSVGGDLKLYGQASLEGLGNLTSIGGGLAVNSNATLKNLSGLDNLTSIGGCLGVGNNYALTSLSGLDNLTSIGDCFQVGYNPALTSLSGLDSLTSIGGFSQVIGNPALASLSNLNNLTSIGGFLQVAGNDALTSLSGLDSLTSIGGSLSLSYNDSITSLSGLDNIDPATITELFIENNPQLIVCDVQSVCDFLENGGPATIGGNAPGCNSVPEVEAACQASPTEEAEKWGNETIKILPNPATDFINLHLPNPFYEPLQVSLFDTQGRLVSQQPVVDGQTMEVGHLPNGMYSLKMVVGERVFVGRFVKQ